MWSYAFISALALLLTSCASIYNGVSDAPSIEFTSSPEGATVALMDGRTCTTPCKITVDTVVEQEAEGTLPDHEPAKILMKTRVSHPFWFNIVFGVVGLLGAGIDWGTGAMWSYSATKHHFVFEADKDGDGGEDAEPDDESDGDVPLAEDESPTRTPLPDLPDTPAVLRIKEAYPKDFLATQIQYYYGGLSSEDVAATTTRLYIIMRDMDAAGERLDIDEAIRRDRFNQPSRQQGEPGPS